MDEFYPGLPISRPLNEKPLADHRDGVGQGWPSFTHVSRETCGRTSSPGARIARLSGAARPRPDRPLEPFRAALRAREKKLRQEPRVVRRGWPWPQPTFPGDGFKASCSIDDEDERAVVAQHPVRRAGDDVDCRVA